MFLLKRTLLVLCFVCMAASACAFDWTYGNWWEVKDVKNEGGVLLMPLTRGKYNNVKVLSKNVYDFLSRCQSDCYSPADTAFFSVSSYRKAKTRERMLIAQVDINAELLVTFLVFKNKQGFSVKGPEAVVFKDKKLEQEIKKYLKNLAGKEL